MFFIWTLINLNLFRSHPSSCIKSQWYLDYKLNFHQQMKLVVLSFNFLISQKWDLALQARLLRDLQVHRWHIPDNWRAKYVDIRIWWWVTWDKNTEWRELVGKVVFYNRKVMFSFHIEETDNQLYTPDSATGFRNWQPQPPSTVHRQKKKRLENANGNGNMNTNDINSWLTMYARPTVLSATEFSLLVTVEHTGGARYCRVV